MIIRKAEKKELQPDGSYLCEVSIPNREIAAVYKSEILSHLLQIGAITRTTANKIAESLYTGDSAKLQKANEEIANLMSEIDNRLAYNITHNETYAANGITSTYGKITLGGKEYAFKYDATFEKPVVYGCMNMDLINEAKAVLDALVHLDRDETTLGQKHANQPVYDFENNIVVWVSDDGVFKGYTDKYAFVWDPVQAQPCGITVINALNNFRRYRKMNASWGNGFVDRANFIMRYCRQMVNRATNDKEVPEYTNEIFYNNGKYFETNLKSLYAYPDNCNYCISHLSLETLNSQIDKERNFVTLRGEIFSPVKLKYSSITR